MSEHEQRRRDHFDEVFEALTEPRRKYLAEMDRYISEFRKDKEKMTKFLIETDGSKVQVDAKAPNNVNPAELMRGLHAHLKTVEQYLHIDAKTLILALAKMVVDAENNPDLVKQDTVVVLTPADNMED